MIMMRLFNFMWSCIDDIFILFIRQKPLEWYLELQILKTSFYQRLPKKVIALGTISLIQSVAITILHTIIINNSIQNHSSNSNISNSSKRHCRHLRDNNPQMFIIVSQRRRNLNNNLNKLIVNFCPRSLDLVWVMLR